MKIHLWGTDFRRGSPELRARLYLAPEEREKRLGELHALGFSDLVYLNTCNRIEFYTTGRDYFCDSRPLWVKALRLFGLTEEDYYRGYHLEGKSALRHLLRVACSLESLVIGEPMILGQLKEAVRWTKEKKLPLDSSLERSFNLAFETAKLVRANTCIAEKPVSVATLGLKHLQNHETRFPVGRVVVVGRGPISIQVVQWFRKNRPQAPILWVNRSVEALQALPEASQPGVELAALSNFQRAPVPFTHLFTATSSPEPIFDAQFFRRLGTEQRLVFDFAQPADVDRSGDTARYATILHLEDFRLEAEENAAARQTAVEQAEAMIEAAIRDHCLESKQAPLLRDFNAVEPKFLEELAQTLQLIERDLPGEVQSRVRKHVEKLVKRNLHHSREHLREVLRRVTEPSGGFRNFM